MFVLRTRLGLIASLNFRTGVATMTDKSAQALQFPTKAKANAEALRVNGADFGVKVFSVCAA